MARVSGYGVAVGLWLTLAVCGCGQTQAPVHASTSTFVSLTFDDGLADQVAIPQILDAHGMKGTFFIISGRIGAPGYLTQDQILALQADGHEVGAHTVHHYDLTTLPPRVQQVEICDSRGALQRLGLTVDSLAYPFGHYSANAEADAEFCGFSSARGIGDIDCPDCPVAESVPVPDRFSVRAPDSIHSDTSLEQIESYVTMAEANGGGWIVLVMHHLCDDCDPYSISQAKLSAFLDWLQRRAERGTVVRTMREMMGAGGRLPPPAPPPATLQNVSLEEDEDGDSVPDCWQEGGYGNNTAVWTRTSDAHSGSWAEKLQITGLTDGDRKLIVDPRDPGCTQVTDPGHTATVTAWYKSDQPVRLVAYVQGADGNWSFWAQSPALPPSSDYTQGAWTTPPIPQDATRLSIGMSLRSVGTLTVDDFSLTQN